MKLTVPEPHPVVVPTPRPRRAVLWPEQKVVRQPYTVETFVAGVMAGFVFGLMIGGAAMLWLLARYAP